ncbi:MAG TPA: aldehyde dehydrogenase family protein [Mycobacteriales bacterium]|jgi:acyl-CoA reductase-like NAD-dependent aldehyde dehydrogenase|nr:aldehyde dehydrogenase family protein [Mycobacteriales bacterium]
MTQPMTIGGRAVVSAHRLPVENPALGTEFADFPDCGPEALDAAVAAAAGTASRWEAASWDERRELLVHCGEALADRAEEVARLLTHEQGKPLERARDEVRLAADWFRMTSELPAEPESVADEPTAYLRVEHVPHGVVAAIGPSSFPIIIAATKIAPALLAGNTVVLTPSPLTPLSTLLMGQVVCDALPPGVLNVISGTAELGARLAGHPGVAMVSFTGSLEVGRQVAAAAAGDLKRTALELGGNDACILLPGADVPAVAERVFERAMDNSGQFCSAIKRVYVSREQQQELVEVLTEIAKRTRVGPGLNPGTELGPLVDAAGLARVDGLVRAAVDAGGRVITGGHPLNRPGHFYPPTVVTDLPPGTALELEEQSGPVLPVIAYDRVDEAVERANATEYGLGGSVWGEETEGRRVARQLDVCTAWVNTHGAVRSHIPVGGYRSSGLSAEYGYWGMLEYTRQRVLNVAR